MLTHSLSSINTFRLQIMSRIRRLCIQKSAHAFNKKEVKMFAKAPSPTSFENMKTFHAMEWKGKGAKCSYLINTSSEWNNWWSQYNEINLQRGYDVIEKRVKRFSMMFWLLNKHFLIIFFFLFMKLSDLWRRGEKNYKRGKNVLHVNKFFHNMVMS